MNLTTHDIHVVLVIQLAVYVENILPLVCVVLKHSEQGCYDPKFPPYTALDGMDRIA